MVTKARFDLKGLEQYLEVIQQAGKDIDAAAQRALMKGAPILKNEMVDLVPVDKGDLQSNIEIDGPYQDGNLNYVEVGVVNADAEMAIIGNVQEYGSPSKNISAQPYIRPAIDHKKSAVAKAQRESLKSEGLAD